MTIDIISYTSEQFAKLSAEQILEVKQAQLRKNKLLLKRDEEMQAEKHRLIENGTFLSSIWTLYCQKLTAQYEQEITQIRDALLFYLQYSAKPSAGTEQSSPYPVDYSLSMSQRVTVVKEYYENAYNKNWTAILEAYKKDEVALSYLGEYYGSLYDYFTMGSVS